MTDTDRMKPYRAVAQSKQFQAPYFGINADEGRSLDDLRIPRYQLDSVLGVGGMGIVYRAKDLELNRQVAIKVLTHLDRTTGLARFERESLALSQLNHINVVPVHTSGKAEDGRPYLVMPLVEGPTLKEAIEREPLGPGEAARLTIQVAHGLHAAHESGLVHRDVKPANILIDSRDGQAKVLDFGLVRGADDSTLTRTHMICGTPEYMSPEQANRLEMADPCSDVYSLGIALYECLTGSVPFRGRPLDVLKQHRESEPIPPRRLNQMIPTDLQTICLKAIEKEPRERYATASMFAEDLQRFVDGRPISARPIGALRKAWRWSLRNRVLAVTGSLGLISLVAGTITSTLLWIDSAQNAATAEAVAQDLKVNRQELRESVRRFQGQIFSDEALHWQMTPSFRSGMFREVIAYLDQFAAQEVDLLKNDGQPDELTEDYLKIAESALAVSNFEDAILAASRALSRMRALNGELPGERSPVTPNLASLSLHSRAAAALLAHQGAQSGRPDELSTLARESRAAAERALEQSPDDLAMTVAASKARFLELSLLPQKSSSVIDELTSIFTQLSELPYELPDSDVARFLAPTTVEFGWTIAASLPYEKAIELLERQERLILNYRAALRSSNRPLGQSDYLRSINLVKIAANQYRQGNPVRAIETVKQALASFHPALAENPQNRLWQREVADLEETLSNWLAEQGDLIGSEQNLTLSIKRHVGNRRGDPQNDSLRERIIALFVKKAELSVRSEHPSQAAQEFYVAAQDCRYFIGNSANPRRAWAFELRLWLIAQVLRYLPDGDESEFAEKFWEWERGYFQHLLSNHPDLDAAKLSAVLDGDYQPPRPAERTAD